MPIKLDSQFKPTQKRTEHHSMLSSPHDLTEEKNKKQKNQQPITWAVTIQAIQATSVLTL